MAVPNLTAVTMDAVFAEAAALGDGPSEGGSELRLSLEEVQFIDPYGLVGLWCVLRYLKRRHPAVVVISPTDRELQGYLRRMSFPAVTSPIAVVEGSVGGRGASGPSDVLLELTPIEQQADVEQVLRRMLGRIRRLLESELGYRERDVTAFCTVLAEACTTLLIIAKIAGSWPPNATRSAAGRGRWSSAARISGSASGRAWRPGTARRSAGRTSRRL